MQFLQEPTCCGVSDAIGSTLQAHCMSGGVNIRIHLTICMYISVWLSICRYVLMDLCCCVYVCI